MIVLFVGFSLCTSPPTLMVSTVVQEPFIIPDPDHPDKPNYFKGMLVDMLTKFQENLPGFTKGTKLVFVKHEKFGIKLPNGTWTGLIGDIVDVISGSSIGLAPVTITADRLNDVKFSLPFFSTGLSAVGRALTFPVIQETLPRILQMALDDKISVGLMVGGSSEDFFQKNDVPIYKKIYEQMMRNPENFVLSYEEGIAKVRSSSNEKPYIFFGEKALLDEYAGTAPCDVSFLTCETLNTIHYALVFRTTEDPSLIVEYNKQIANLLTSGLMQKLKKKWYKKECRNETAIASKIIL